MNDLGKLDSELGDDWTDLENEIMDAASSPQLDRFVAVLHTKQWPPPDVTDLDNVKWVPMVLVLELIWTHSDLGEEFAKRMSTRLVNVPMDSVAVFVVHRSPCIKGGYVVAVNHFVPVPRVVDLVSFPSRGGQA